MNATSPPDLKPYFLTLDDLDDLVAKLTELNDLEQVRGRLEKSYSSLVTIELQHLPWLQWFLF